MPALAGHNICFTCRYGEEALASSKVARRAVEAEQAPSSRGQDLLHRLWKSGVRLELHHGDRVWYGRAIDLDLAAEARAWRDDLVVALRVEGPAGRARAGFDLAGRSPDGEDLAGAARLEHQVETDSDARWLQPFLAEVYAGHIRARFSAAGDLSLISTTEPAPVASSSPRRVGQVLADVQDIFGATKVLHHHESSPPPPLRIHEPSGLLLYKCSSCGVEHLSHLFHRCADQRGVELASPHVAVTEDEGFIESLEDDDPPE